MNQQKTFFMIWNPNGHSPTRKHWSIEDARIEAKRLATLKPTQKFIILRAVESFKFKPEPFEIKSYSNKGS